ncbi:MAG: hypothetical protein ACE5FG_15885 [Myxococcota bacterium]
MMIALCQAEALPFDRGHGIDPHHLALAVEDETALEKLHERLARTEEVGIELLPEPLGRERTRHMTCAIPGGIRVEFIALAS